MKMNVLVRFLAVISLLFSVHSIALSEISPYQGVVSAEGITEEQLREQALEQVLIKVSGNVNIIELDDSKALAKDIFSLLAQFGYQNINNKRFYFTLFDKRKIDNALTAMQQPIWGQDRPKTLIWLVNENRELISENMINSREDDLMTRGLKSAQLARGITVEFPLIDLDDALAVSAADINGRFYQTVADAASRYDAEYFVVANLIKIRGEQWQLKWELVKNMTQSNDSQVLIKQSSSGDKADVMNAMINQIADYYAKQFAILENKGLKSTQKLTVNNIRSLTHLIRLNKMLEGLNAVDTFEIVNITEQQVVVSVTLKGGLVSFKNALNAHSQLKIDLTTASPFHYNWQP